MSSTAGRVLLVADDLTGAAESGAAFLPRAVRIETAPPARGLRVSREPSGDGCGVVVVDTDSRYLSERAAADRCRAALRRGGAGATVVKKIDSTLRGPLAAEVAELAADGAPVLVATASPALGRTVVGGVVHVHGVPLARSGVWDAEPRPAPASVPAALAPVRCAVVELAAVRRDPAELTERLRDVLAGGAVPVCDAETEDDLDRIVRAGRRTGRPVRWVGSAGLAYALARALPPPLPRPSEPEGGAADAAGPVLFVVGSASAVAREQVARLAGLVADVVADVGADVVADVVDLDPQRRSGAAVAAAAVATGAAVAADRLAGRHGVLRLPELAAGRAGVRSPAAAAALARTAAAVAATHGPLVLTGGETARAVLTELGVADLRVRAAWDDGAVVSETPDGRTIVTKPGAFGGPDALLRIARRLGAHPARPPAEQPAERPREQLAGQPREQPRKQPARRVRQHPQEER